MEILLKYFEGVDNGGHIWEYKNLLNEIHSKATKGKGAHLFFCTNIFFSRINKTGRPRTHNIPQDQTTCRILNRKWLRWWFVRHPIYQAPPDLYILTLFNQCNMDYTDVGVLIYIIYIYHYLLTSCIYFLLIKVGTFNHLSNENFVCM